MGVIIEPSSKDMERSEGDSSRPYLLVPSLLTVCNLVASDRGSLEALVSFQRPGADQAEAGCPDDSTRSAVCRVGAIRLVFY